MLTKRKLLQLLQSKRVPLDAVIYFLPNMGTGEFIAAGDVQIVGKKEEPPMQDVDGNDLPAGSVAIWPEY
jgi:hypothetical protein